VLGLNRRFAKYMGFKVDRLRLLALCLSGGLAGLGGAAVVLGIQYRYVQGLSAGYGFDGVLVSLMAAQSSCRRDSRGDSLWRAKSRRASDGSCNKYPV